MSDLIEDEDGAPLPDELQVGSAIYDAVRVAVTLHNFRCEYDSATAHDIARHAMVALAPILWPLMPTNPSGRLAEVHGIALDALDLIETMDRPRRCLRCELAGRRG